jgi:chromosome segregation ATPase
MSEELDQELNAAGPIVGDFPPMSDVEYKQLKEATKPMPHRDYTNIKSCFKRICAAKEEWKHLVTGDKAATEEMWKTVRTANDGLEKEVYLATKAEFDRAHLECQKEQKEWKEANARLHFENRRRIKIQKDLTAAKNKERDAADKLKNNNRVDLPVVSVDAIALHNASFDYVIGLLTFQKQGHAALLNALQPAQAV